MSIRNALRKALRQMMWWLRDPELDDYDFKGVRMDNGIISRDPPHQRLRVEASPAAFRTDETSILVPAVEESGLLVIRVPLVFLDAKDVAIRPSNVLKISRMSGCAIAVEVK